MLNKIMIIGGGIAGLAAGCYARMNGYEAQIFEMHRQPGGLCTSWSRQGYLFDGCIHWLAGSGPGNSMYHFWEELGAVQNTQFINHEAVVRVELPGLNFTFYSDLDRMEAYLLSLAPEDKEAIQFLINGGREFASVLTMPSKPVELFTDEDEKNLAPVLAVWEKWGRVTMGDITGRFVSPLLKNLFSMLWPAPAPALLAVMPMAYAHQKAAGYPIGGSLAFAQAIEKRFLSLGGEIIYNARVEKILVEEDCAVGVRLADGRELKETPGQVTIISAADGRSTIFDMLEGRYCDEAIRFWYDHIPLIPAITQVSLGVGMPVEVSPSTMSGVAFPLAEPIHVSGEEVGFISLQSFGFDPSTAPEGKTALRVTLPGNYTFWKELAKDPQHYTAEKEAVARQVVDALDKRYPGLAARVEVVDVATPLTFERYTGNWQGSSQGWVLTPETLEGWLPVKNDSRWRWKKTLPGLDHFYQCGQWVEPGGGVPTAAISGRNVIQLICARDGKTFGTTTL